MTGVFFGVDYGTSNSVVAVRGGNASSDSTVVPIRQRVSEDAVADLCALPSAVLGVPDQERRPIDSLLPWENVRSGAWIVGEYARVRGALLPERLITSAKSWLCNNHVGRKDPILPWGSVDSNDKISPFDAAVLCLRHLREAAEVKLREMGVALDPSSLVLTVPASFDQAARALIREAARDAGLPDVVLLEEPLAALYAWLDEHQGEWRKALSIGDLVLVVDVGGGTSDFTLVAVVDEGGSIGLRRVTVGEHILLGGDNMDLAAARLVRHKLEQEGKNLDQWQFSALVQGVRGAKERLLSGAMAQTERISLPSRRGSLFESTISVDLHRDELEPVLLDGFFPVVEPTARPVVTKGALREFGLSYASDAAVTKHLAKFLSDSSKVVAGSPELSSLLSAAGVDVSSPFVKPTAILFNGGVFSSSALAERVCTVVQQWNGSGHLKRLTVNDPASAVARGAAYFAELAKAGSGLRIRAGLSRSYYLGVEEGGLAVPGLPRKTRGVCLLPQGLEEGSEVALPGHTFGLLVGEPAEFRLFSSNMRSQDAVGDVVLDAERELTESARLESTIDDPGGVSAAVVPVTMKAKVDDVGTLELLLVQSEPTASREWKLEFNVRAQPE
jgi:hypothetical protein